MEAPACRRWQRRSCPRKLLLLLHLVVLLGSTAVVRAGKVPAIIVFGDSTVDAGNNNVIPTMLKSNFRPYGRDFYNGQPTGRFCNGRIPTDFISEGFSLKPTVPAYLDPAYDIEDFATGVSFASAGSGFDTATSDVLQVIPLWKEVEYFKEYITRLRSYQGDSKADETIAEALYIVSIGTNDFLENYYTIPRRSSHMTVDQFTDFLVGLAGEFLHNIYDLGARKVSFTGLSLMGCLPLERATNLAGGNACVDKYNDVAKKFNDKVRGLVNKLVRELPGYRLVLTETFDAFLDVIQNPSSYGFDNVEKGCCASGTFEMGYLCDEWNPFTCSDADKYVFWDAFHPTEKMNRIFADQSLNTTLKQFL